MERRESFEVRVPIEVAFDFFSDPSQAFERRAPQFRVRWEGSIGSGSTFAIDGPNPSALGKAFDQKVDLSIVRTDDEDILNADRSASALAICESAIAQCSKEFLYAPSFFLA